MSKVPEIDFPDLAIEFLAEAHRTPRFIAWHQGMLGGGIELLNNNFRNYCYGDVVSQVWDNSSSYNLNDTAVTSFGVYISLVSSNLNNNPDNTTGFWYKISPSFIGAQERSQYNAQKLMMEFALNRWFRLNFVQPTSIEDGTDGIWYLPLSDIYITTTVNSIITFLSGETFEDSSYSSELDSGNAYSTETVITGSDTTYRFIVWVPTSLATSLGSSYEQIISNVVNLMKIEGTLFTIQTY